MRLKIFLSTLCVGTAVLAGAHPAPAADQALVMSRNLYLGADLMPLAIYGKDPAQVGNFSKTVSWVWGNVGKTGWNTRVRGLAKELKTKRPDLVGVQEAALWLKSTTPTGKPKKVVYDYLASLLREAKRQGITYRVVGYQNEFDFTVPTSLGYRLRFVQRDAILARTNTPWKLGRATKAHYRETFKVDTPVGTANSLRGWLAANGTGPHGQKFRFVTTHLEAYGDAIRNTQAGELVASGLRTSLPTILVGDMNSDPGELGASGDAYRTLVSGGMNDAFGTPVPTDGQDGMLRNPTSQLSHWIDHIMTRGAWTPTGTWTVGDQPGDRVGGLWPSDHAGILARLQLG